MRSLAHEPDQLVYLSVCADLHRADQQANRAFRKLRDQLPHERHGCIRLFVHRKQNFVFGIGLPAEAGKIVARAEVHAADRLKHAHRWRMRGRVLGAFHREEAQSRKRRQRVVQQRQGHHNQHRGPNHSMRMQQTIPLRQASSYSILPRLLATAQKPASWLRNALGKRILPRSNTPLGSGRRAPVEQREIRPFHPRCRLTAAQLRFLRGLVPSRSGVVALLCFALRRAISACASNSCNAGAAPPGNPAMPKLALICIFQSCHSNFSRARPVRSFSRTIPTFRGSTWLMASTNSSPPHRPQKSAARVFAFSTSANFLSTASPAAGPCWSLTPLNWSRSA